MAIRTFIQNLGATQVFMLDGDNTNDGSDGGAYEDTGNDDSIYSWETSPVCEGVTESMKSESGSDYTTSSDGFTIHNNSDINNNPVWKDTAYTIGMWFKVESIDTVSCIYEQGGSSSNMAFVVGYGKSITWQGADAGQPFLLATSKNQVQVGRPYLLFGVWEYKDFAGNPNNYNRVKILVNGVLHDTVMLDGTDVFPTHTGDINVGNTKTAIKSFNEDKQFYTHRGKWFNMWVCFPKKSISESDLRELFERTTLAEVTIASDTWANQQVALDALIGNTYENKNCSIRILQATDATDYTLLLENIAFVRNDTLKDIHVQFVGTGVLSLENCNGSNAYQFSTPDEVETSSAIIGGGGSLSNTNDSYRHKTTNDLTDKRIEGNLFIDLVEDSTINLKNIVVLGKVYNYNPNKKVTIIADTGCSLPIDDEGPGNGQVLLEYYVPIKVRVIDSVGNRIQGARVFLEEVVSGSQLINTLSDSTGEVLIQYKYTQDIDISGRVRLASGGQYYKTSKLSGTIESNGLSIVTILLKDG